MGNFRNFHERCEIECETDPVFFNSFVHQKKCVTIPQQRNLFEFVQKINRFYFSQIRLYFCMLLFNILVHQGENVLKICGRENVKF